MSKFDKMMADSMAMLDRARSRTYEELQEVAERVKAYSKENPLLGGAIHADHEVGFYDEASQLVYTMKGIGEKVHVEGFTLTAVIPKGWEPDADEEAETAATSEVSDDIVD